MKKEIDFASEHLYDLLKDKENELQKLQLFTIDMIIKNEKLIINSEDQLITFINHLCSNSKDYCDLYKYVQFSNVEQSKIDEFLNVFDPSYINNEIWKSISQRFNHKIVIDPKSIAENNRYSQKRFPFIYSKQHDGIFSYLKEKSNGNVLNEVNITPLNTSNGYEVGKLFDNDPNKRFCSQNISNSYIIFDFKDKSIILTDYKIQTSPFDSNWHHPRSWKIQGSNDNNNWEEIDKQENCKETNENNVYQEFSIKQENIKQFKFIKMIMDGVDWGNQNWMTFSSIEFYGCLVVNS